MFSFSVCSVGKGLLTRSLKHASISGWAHSLFFSLLPETQTHLSAPPINTLMSFMSSLIQSFAHGSLLRDFSVAMSLFKHHLKRQRVHFKQFYAALSIRPCWFFLTCMVKLFKKNVIVKLVLQAIGRSANAFAPSCGMLKCVFNLWLQVKFRREKCMLIPRSALSEIPHL